MAGRSGGGIVCQFPGSQPFRQMNVQPVPGPACEISCTRVAPIQVAVIDDMKEFRLPEKDFRVLLEMIVLARTIVDYHDGTNREEWIDAVERVSDNVLRQADEFGCGDLLAEETDEDGGTRLAPVADFSDNSFHSECLNAAAEHMFWEEMVARLTDRDLSRNVSEDEWNMLPAHEQDRRRRERDEFYWKEFESHGIDRIELVPRERLG